MNNARTRLGRLATVGLLLATMAGVAPAASAGSSTSNSGWVAKSIAAQLARKPGGVVSGNTITYPGVKLTYTAQVTPGMAVPMSYHGCNSGQICLYTDPNQLGGVKLETTSLWCRWEGGQGGPLHLNGFGLEYKVVAADSENGYYSAGYIPVSGSGAAQRIWTMSPNGDVYNEDAITDVEVCASSDDLE